MNQTIKETVKAHITQGKDGKLTLRLFLTPEQRNDYVLERGTQPENIFQIVVVGK